MRVGDKVEFYRTHDKAHKLKGKVKKVDAENDLVIVTTDEADGNAAVDHTVHPADVKVVSAAEVESAD